MLQSMTGFGKAVVELPGKKVVVELRSLNSKNLDLYLRLPSYFKEKEAEIRRMVSVSLQRGKISLNMTVEAGEEALIRINTDIVKSYIEQLKNIAPSTDYLRIAMRLPDSVSNFDEEIPGDEWMAVREGIESAIGKLIEFRLAEGEVLRDDFLKRTTLIRRALTQVGELTPLRMERIKERLHKALEDFKIQVDENRYEQEMIYYLERLDITEEQVRLENHLNQFEKTLMSEASQGKKLGFIVQEMGREINTIGSKANFAPIQNEVVGMKDELEKIKEQLLNIL